MADRCVYTVEVPAEYHSLLDGWSSEEQVWECKRPVDNSRSDRCRYHRSPDDTNNNTLQQKFKSDLTAETADGLELVGAVFEYVSLDSISVTRPVYLVNATIAEGHITNCLFTEAYFHDAEFDEIDFSHTRFDHVQFDGETTFADAAFTHTEFEDADFSDATFEQADFRHATFDQVTFRDANFLRESHFENANFGDSAVMTDTQFNRGDFSNAALQWATLEDADLSNTILFGTDLRGSSIAGTQFNGAQIDDDTEILGDPTNEQTEGHEYSLAALLTKRRCIYDPQATFGEDTRQDISNQVKGNLTQTDLRDRARRVYRTLESLGQQAARPQLEARSFVRRKGVARRQYRADARNKTQYTIAERAIATFQWMRAEVSRSIFLYGESPWRILGWSGVFMLVFGVIFAFGGHIETASNSITQVTPAMIGSAPVTFLSAVVESIYYSMLVYTTLGFSSYQLAGAGKALGVVEAVLGIVMASLLVFVFGRRASR